VSHDGGIGDWPHDEKLEMRAPEKPVGVGGVSTVELWIVPANAAGTWASDIPGHGERWRWRVKQKYQMLEIDLAVQGRDLLVRTRGCAARRSRSSPRASSTVAPWHHYFVGQVKGDQISGEVTVSDGNNRKVFPWNASRTSR